MKRIVAAVLISGAAVVALRRVGPALMARAHQKCSEMFETHSNRCPPKEATTCSDSSCAGMSPDIKDSTPSSQRVGSTVG